MDETRDNFNLEQNQIELLTNIIYNLHSSKHIIHCFKDSDECRYNLPKPPQMTTEIIKTKEIHD